MGLYKKGEYVKARFVSERMPNIGESMWLKVDYSDDASRIVYGKLNNDPVVVTDLRPGMDMVIGYDRIMEHRKKDKVNKS